MTELKPINQCDGCRAGIPLDRGMHINPKNPWNGMVCQKERYEAVKTANRRHVPEAES